MSLKNGMDPFGPLLAVTLFGARVGFAAGLGLAAAELSAGFAPLGWQVPMFALSGATSTTFFWWIGCLIVRAEKREGRGSKKRGQRKS